MSPFLSVVIPALDHDAIGACLAALNTQTYACDRFEVIVVHPEGDLGDASANVRWVQDSRRGAPAARNLGVSQAKGEVIAFIEARCVPAANWLEQGVRAMQSTGNVLVAGRIELTSSEPLRPTAVEIFETRWSLRQDIDVHTRGVAAAANLFVPAEALRSVGGFNEALLNKSDWELCLRTTEAGYPLVYSPEAGVRQAAIRNLAGLWRSKLRLARGRFHLARARGVSRNRARLSALWELRPPLRAIGELVTEREIDWRSRAAVLGVMVVARVGFLSGWLAAELSQVEK